MERRRLSQILQGSSADRLQAAWNQTQAAAEFSPLPRGNYKCRLEKGERFKSHNKQTDGYRLTFRVTGGEYQGRLVWHELWLTEAAMAISKRELAKLDVTEWVQLDSPLPAGIVCQVNVVLHQEDDGSERNRVRSFEVLRIDPPTADPFAPSDDPDQAPPGDLANGEAGDPSFDRPGSPNEGEVDR